MAHMKQQIKRYKNDDAKHLVHVSLKSSLKTERKKVLQAVAEGNKEAAVEALNVCNKKLDSFVSKGIYHKNYASRQKSRLQKKVNTLA